MAFVGFVNGRLLFDYSAANFNAGEVAIAGDENDSMALHIGTGGTYLWEADGTALAELGETEFELKTTVDLKLNDSEIILEGNTAPTAAKHSISGATNQININVAGATDILAFAQNGTERISFGGALEFPNNGTLNTSKVSIARESDDIQFNVVNAGDRFVFEVNGSIVSDIDGVSGGLGAFSLMLGNSSVVFPNASDNSTSVISAFGGALDNTTGGSGSATKVCFLDKSGLDTNQFGHTLACIDKAMNISLLNGTNATSGSDMTLTGMNAGSGGNGNGGDIILTSGLKDGSGVPSLVRTTTRFSNAKGADIASANSITLGEDGNSFDITGTTTINNIAVAGWQNGSKVTLKFDGVLTVTDQAGGSGQLRLAGSTNLTTAANTRIVIELDGTEWFEIARTVA